MNRQEEVNVFEKIQTLCHQYRRQLKNGEPAKLEELLTLVEKSARETLFQNLLLLDIEYRRGRNQRVSSQDYIERFPNYARLIRHAFFESTMLVSRADDAAKTVTLNQPDAQRLGNYQLIRRLGRGAFGVVYEARHLERRHHVALKTLPIEVSASGEQLH